MIGGPQTGRMFAVTGAVRDARHKAGGKIERPNMIVVISDQFRWDCICAMDLNPMNLTPKLVDTGL